ncbi:MAG: ATP-binding protein [Pseudomonadales bacterium]|nr:ATP-binding protein [Pseudomonadales bacterium]
MGISSDLKESPLGFSDYYRERSEKLAMLTTGKICISLTHKPEETGGVLAIRIEDSGTGFDHFALSEKQPKTQGYSGRGIPLIRSMCRSFDYHGVGNIVEAVFAWRFRE